jgi:hypothetical protein
VNSSCEVISVAPRVREPAATYTFPSCTIACVACRPTVNDASASIGRSPDRALRPRRARPLATAFDTDDEEATVEHGSPARRVGSFDVDGSVDHAPDAQS